MTDTTRSELDIDETTIETDYGTVTLTFDSAEINWADLPGRIDPTTERLASEELVLDSALALVSSQLGEKLK